MLRLAVIIIICFFELAVRVSNQPNNLGGCSCYGFACGPSGSTNGISCWYACCWMTMSLIKNYCIV